MVTTVLERYDSECGDFAEIACEIGEATYMASIYGDGFKLKFMETHIDIESARKAITDRLPQPYTVTRPQRRV